MRRGLKEINLYNTIKVCRNISAMTINNSSVKQFLINALSKANRDKLIMLSCPGRKRPSEDNLRKNIS